jgi:hypothetical protein
LAAIVYFAGAIALWLRLHKAGYPADLALEHQTRSEVVAVGLRGLLIITGLFAALAACWGLANFLANRLAGWIDARPARREHAHRLKRQYLKVVRAGLRVVGPVALLLLLKDVDQRYVGIAMIAIGVAAFATTLMATGRGSPIRLVGLVVAVIGASLVSWRTFGVVLAVAVALGLSFLAHETRWRPLPGSVVSIAILGAAAVIATVSWEIDGTVRWQGAYLSPIPPFLSARSSVPENLPNVAFPYFGETGDRVFVADVREAHKTDDGRWEWEVCCGDGSSRVVEIKREDVRLSFPGEKSVLYFSREPPATSLWNFLKREF